MDQPAVKEDYFTDSDSEAEDPPVLEVHQFLIKRNILKI